MQEGALWPVLREYWHPVAFVEDLNDGPISVQFLDERVVVCRLGGEVKAFYDLCIHRGTPLSLGWVEGDQLVCAYHGWSYAGDGRCTRIPSVPDEHPIPRKACLTPYRAAERYGLVWVCMSDEPRAPIPDFPEYDDPDYTIFFRQKKRWGCTAARSIENFVDFGHFPWVHEGILGDRAEPLVDQVEIRREEESLRFGIQNIPDALHAVSHSRNYRLTRPFTIYQWKIEESGQREVYFYCNTPHTNQSCTRYLIVGRNYDLDAPEITRGPFKIEGDQVQSERNGGGAPIPHYVQRLDIIADQDQPIVENQRPWELPLDLAEELHLKGPDAVAVAYRRFMRELGVEVDEA